VKNITCATFLSVLIGILLQSMGWGGESPSTTELRPKLDIRPKNEKEWEAGMADVKKVLYSSARELTRYFPEQKIPVIEVTPKGGPITLYDRGPNGEIRVKLNTGKLYWAQYSFQFAHEMCHVMCDCKPRANPNHWFEESLCETASIFVLRKMAQTWKTEPPYPHWKDYSKALDNYASERIALGKTPEGKTFKVWFKENEQDMRLKSTDRARNNIVAGVLLPLFEAEPEMWESLVHLNEELPDKFRSIKDHLDAWRRNSPEKQRPFIDKIIASFF